MTLADIRVGIRAHLLSNSDIAAIVGARVYPILIPQGGTGPCIVYSRISSNGDTHYTGPSGLAGIRVQIDCWATSVDTANTLANLVKEFLDGTSASILWGDASPAEAVIVQGMFFENMREDYDHATKMYRISADYSVWYAER